MLKKKQVLIIMVSIAVTSFLVGTMFNVATMATSSGSPWDRVWAAISGLEYRVETLENQLPQQGFIGAPAYDSGWVDIAVGEAITLTHNLNTTELFVYMIGRNQTGTIHQIRYGTANGKGAYWKSLTEHTIVIARTINDDTIVLGWNQIRVMIWKIQPTP